MFCHAMGAKCHLGAGKGLELLDRDDLARDITDEASVRIADIGVGLDPPVCARDIFIDCGTAIDAAAGGRRGSQSGDVISNGSGRHGKLLPNILWHDW